MIFFNYRRALVEMYEEWRTKHNVDDCAFNVISFLICQELINEEKAIELMKIRAGMDPAITNSPYFERNAYDEEHYEVNPAYKEIIKLHNMLAEQAIPHVIRRNFDGWHVCYPVFGDGRVISVIEHQGSYGRHNDLLEIMGLLTPEEETYDSVAGHLTADDVFERIKKHWEESNKCTSGN